MTQFTKNLSKDDRYAIILEIKETDTNASNNTSTISYSLKAKKSSGSGYYTNNSNNPYSITIDGIKVKDNYTSYDFRGSTPKTITLSSGTRTITHNADGKKTISVSGYFKDENNSLGSATASGSVVLTNLNRGIIPTFSDNPATLGEQITITHTRPARETGTDYYFIIKIIINNEVRTTITSSYSDSTNWTPPLNYANYFPNSSTGTCIVSCETHKVTGIPSSDEILGTQEVNLGLIIPSSIIPSVEIGTLLEANPTMINKNWNVFVQNKSQISISVTASGIYGSTIESVVTTINNTNITGVYDSENDKWVFTTPILITAGINTIITTVTDSRGRTSTDTQTYTVLEYANPSITTVEAQRCLQDGTLSENGTYVLYTFNGSISPVDSHNQTLFKIGYKKTTDENYTYVTVGQSSTINANNEVSTFNISSDYEYDIVFQASDSFMNTEINRTLDVGFDLLSFNPSGKAMAIGKVSQANSNEKLLEVALPTVFSENIDGEGADFEFLSINNEPIITIETYEEYTGATASDTTDTITYNITKNGYTPIGIVGINCDHSRASMIRLFRWYINNNEANVSYRNVGTNPLIANDTSITIYVAYIKNII